MANQEFNRRRFLKITAISGVAGLLARNTIPAQAAKKNPNVLFILADQWRALATPYAGDPNVIAPNLNRLAAESVNMTNAVSGCPVCCPYRASLITGRYPLTNGVFMNDVHLNNEATSLAQAYTAAGYDTGYIGKWHLDGHGRSSFIPRERRQGFDYWKALECTHNYNNSFYYGDENVKLKWDGYDAIAQTHDAQQYIRDHAGLDKPFLLVLSWGPPHAPYETAPEKYRDLFKDKAIELRPNVPEEMKDLARKDLRGYYAHMAALDDCIGGLLKTLRETDIAENTIVVFTADHGDMLYSHGFRKKQQPWDEAIKVPFLLRYPALLAGKNREIDMPINTPDIMPTLLSLSGVDIPRTVEGKDFSGVMLGTQKPFNDAVLITCPSPFGQWNRVDHGGKEYRGVRTRRYTYAQDLDGPWLLYDNQEDPYQQNNLINKPEFAHIQAELEQELQKKLKATNDEFLPGPVYLECWGYEVNEKGTVPYTN